MRIDPNFRAAWHFGRGGGGEAIPDRSNKPVSLVPSLIFFAGPCDTTLSSHCPSLAVAERVGGYRLHHRSHLYVVVEAKVVMAIPFQQLKSVLRPEILELCRMGWDGMGSWWWMKWDKSGWVLRRFRCFHIFRSKVDKASEGLGYNIMGSDGRGWGEGMRGHRQPAARK